MASLEQLIKAVATARAAYVSDVSQLTDQQATWKPADDVWSAVDNTEHLFWAEQGGILGMWKVLRAKQAGAPVWAGEPIHRGLSIEEIVTRTWQPRENVPAVAAPRLGGPIGFWLVSLSSLQQPLENLGSELASEDLEAIIHPHPISGPMDVRQRLEFLRFHIDRHRSQVANLRRQLV